MEQVDQFKKLIQHLLKEYFYKKCTNLDFSDDIQLDSNTNTIVLQDANQAQTAISIEKELAT